MLIIIEGPDGAGKTTLANRLVTYIAAKFPTHRVKLLHKGPPTRHPLTEYAVPLLDYIPGEGTHYILDRWHWGEMVYPAVTGRKTEMTDAMFVYTEMLVRQRGGLVVNLTAPDGVLLERCAGRPEMFGEDVILKASTLFTELSDRTYTPIRFNSVLVEDIVDSARQREHLATIMRDQRTPVMSTFSPKVLLFGDVRVCPGGAECRHRVRHYTRGTAFMPYSATSGDYLINAYGPFELLRDHVALANACDVDDPARIRDVFHFPSIIALGSKAHNRLARERIRHASVPHPQYVRRFHHAAAAEYGQLIREVVGTTRNEISWQS